MGLHLQKSLAFGDPSSCTINQCVSTFTVTIGVFGLGTVLGWSSPAFPDMVMESGGNFRNVTEEERSWIASIATLGALVSSPVAGFAVERLGRKGSLIVTTFPFILGWLVVGYAHTVGTMCLGRFITGFCGGTFSLCAPLYIAETVSSRTRGMLLNSFQLMLVSGILFTYIVGAYVSWKTMTLTCAVIPVIFLLLATFIPESPVYLAKKGKTQKCDQALAWFHGQLYQTLLYQDLEESGIEIEGYQPMATFQNLSRKVVLKPLLISLSLMILEQACAINVVIFYCVDIFSQTGSSLNEYCSSILVAIVQVLANVGGIFLVDRVGRRPLLILSQLVMALSFLILGAFFYLKNLHPEQIIPSALGWLPVATVVVFVIAFSLGIGPLCWTIMGEILPPNMKGVCSALATSSLWMSAFVVTKIYQTLVSFVGIHGTFWIYSSVSLVGTGIVYRWVPETKGKTLEEIQREFFP